MKESQQFGKRIRKLRTQAGITLRELAEKIDVDFSYLSKIENGVLPPPSEEVISKLAEVLNDDKDDLMALARRIPSHVADLLRNQAKLEFGPKLKELRIRAGMSQRELGDKVGIDPTYLSKIENGIMPPPSKKIIPLLADALNVNKDKLMSLAGKIYHSKRNRKRPDILKPFKNLPRITEPITIKSFARVAIAIMLVMAVGTSLWFASPHPVRALDIDITNPSTGTVGRVYTFSVNVSVQNMDVLPIARVDIRIYNVADPTNKKAYLENLPLQTVSKQTHSVTAGSAQVKVSTGSGWGYASPGGRTGYGYGYATGSWGYLYPTGPGGYGYGYGTYQGVTWINYTIYWTSPSGWAGTYEIKPIVWGDDSATPSNGFTVPTLASFTLSAAPAPAPVPTAPVEGPEPRPTPTVEDVSDIVDENGVFTSLARIESGDGNVNLFIPKGTTGLTQEDEPISEISITRVTAPPDPPEDYIFIGLYYDLEPSGATFDPEITLTFTYNPAWIPEGIDPENLTIAYYDEDTDRWVMLDAEDIVIDPDRNTITASISHFTYFAPLARISPAAFTASDLTITPAEVDIAQEVTISATITNTGDLAGSYDVTLKINGKAVSTKKVTLAGGATEKVTFITIQGAPGSYVVSVNGLSGKFAVKPVPIAPVVITAPPAPAPPVPAPAPAPPVPAPPVPAPVPAPTPWWLLAVIAVATIIVVGLVLWFFAFRREY